MPGPKKIYQWQQSGAIPAPEDLGDDERAALLQQPWFQRTLDMHRMGVDVTPDLVQKLMQQPNAQGYEIKEIDMGGGEKAKAVIDVATGLPIPPQHLFRPDFQTQFTTDPETGVRIFSQSRNSAEQEKLPTAPAKSQDNPLMQTIPPGGTSPISFNGKPVGFFVNTGKGIEKHLFNHPEDYDSGEGANEPEKPSLHSAINWLFGKTAPRPQTPPAASAPQTTPESHPAASTPAVGAKRTQNGFTYIWNGSNWQPQ